MNPLGLGKQVIPPHVSGEEVFLPYHADQVLTGIGDIHARIEFVVQSMHRPSIPVPIGDPVVGQGGRERTLLGRLLEAVQVFDCEPILASLGPVVPELPRGGPSLQGILAGAEIFGGFVASHHLHRLSSLIKRVGQARTRTRKKQIYYNI